MKKLMLGVLILIPIIGILSILGIAGINGGNVVVVESASEVPINSFTIFIRSHIGTDILIPVNIYDYAIQVIVGIINYIANT